jgi:hypothetical protein
VGESEYSGFYRFNPGNNVEDYGGDAVSITGSLGLDTSFVIPFFTYGISFDVAVNFSPTGKGATVGFSHGFSLLSIIPHASISGAILHYDQAPTFKYEYDTIEEMKNDINSGAPSASLGAWTLQSVATRPIAAQMLDQMYAP